MIKIKDIVNQAFDEVAVNPIGRGTIPFPVDGFSPMQTTSELKTIDVLKDLYALPPKYKTYVKTHCMMVHSPRTYMPTLNPFLQLELHRFDTEVMELPAKVNCSDVAHAIFRTYSNLRELNLFVRYNRVPMSLKGHLFLDTLTKGI